MINSKRYPVLAMSTVMFASFAFSSSMLADEKKPIRPVPEEVAKKTPPKIQLAILLDTSGSMDGLINQARTQLWKIVNELGTTKRNGIRPELYVALYEYGKSTIPKSQGYLRKIVPLTDDLDKISEELFALKTNGGSEHCGQVIDAAVKNLKWSSSDDDLKLIFICGNEGFNQGPVNYKDACQSAIKRGITVNTIFCGPRATGISTFWQHGAQLADGSFTNIDQNRQVAVINTPFDQKLTALSSKINKTYVAFGKEADRKRRLNRQIAQDKLAQNAAPAAGAARAAFKGKAAYNASAWDLIDALKRGKIKLETIKKELLPKEMQSMTLAQRKAYLKKKSAERDSIRAEIKKLSAQRTKFIAEVRKKQAEKSKTEALDEAVIKIIRKQAAKKKFQFEKK